MSPHEHLVTRHQYEVTETTPSFDNHISFLRAITRLADQENTVNTEDWGNSGQDFVKSLMNIGWYFIWLSSCLEGANKYMYVLLYVGSPQVASGYFHKVLQKTDSQEENIREC